MTMRSYPKLTEGALAFHLARQLRQAARLDAGGRPLGSNGCWRVWVAFELAPARNGSHRLGVHGREAPPRCARPAAAPLAAADLECCIRQRLAHRSTDHEGQAALRRQRLRQMQKYGGVMHALLPARDGGEAHVASEVPRAPVDRQPKPGVRSCRVLNGHPVRRQPRALRPTPELAKPHRARR
jgi:hypothetical protein